MAGYMQDLANMGHASARSYVFRCLDSDKEPASAGYRSNLAMLETGPRSTSFKGSRRQLHADPLSPNKTYSWSGGTEI